MTETEQLPEQLPNDFDPGLKRFAGSVIQQTRVGKLPFSSVARYAGMGRELVAARLTHTASLFDAKRGEDIKAGDRADQLEDVLLQSGQVRLVWVSRTAAATVRQ